MATDRRSQMHLLRLPSEADMIASFLRAEMTSLRFGSSIKAQLEHDRTDRSLVEAPDITNASDNAYRRQLLAAYRAYVFDELPVHITWYRALLDREELAKVRYINYDYWNELSAQTRLAIVATETIRAGREIFGQSNQAFLQAAQALRAGAHFPKMIILGTSPQSALTVYEGHLRLTAYLLAPECIPEQIKVIAGFAPECAHI
jgi:hypothetical protein